MEIAKQIREWAEEACKKHTELQKQKDYVIQRILGSQRVITELAEQAAETYAFCKIYAARSTITKEVKAGIVNFNNNTSKRTARIMEMAQCSLLDRYYCGNKPIMECSFGEALQEGHNLKARGVGLIQKANIFLKIGKLGPAKSLIKQKLKPEKILKIIGSEESKNKTA